MRGIRLDRGRRGPPSRRSARRASLRSRPSVTTRGVEPTIEGPGTLRTGADVVLATGPVQSHVIVQSGAQIVLGDDVYIGFGAAISCHERILIGDRVRIGAYCAIMDTDFHVVGDTRSVPPPGPVRIDDDVRLGPNVVVLRGSHIGAHSVVEPGSVVWGEIPPNSYIVENPKSAESLLPGR